MVSGDNGPGPGRALARVALSTSHRMQGDSGNLVVSLRGLGSGQSRRQVGEAPATTFSPSRT